MTAADNRLSVEAVLYRYRTGMPWREITEQNFDATFSLNTRGALFAVQKALPLFNDGGSIFMTGSVASVKGFPGYGVYSASKAALRSFARTGLNELKGRNIRVNVLSPRPIATPMQDQVLTEEAKQMFESLPSSAFVAKAFTGAKFVKGFNHLIAATLAADPIVEGGHRSPFCRATTRTRSLPWRP